MVLTNRRRRIKIFTIVVSNRTIPAVNYVLDCGATVCSVCTAAHIKHLPGTRRSTRLLWSSSVAAKHLAAACSMYCPWPTIRPRRTGRLTNYGDTNQLVLEVMCQLATVSLPVHVRPWSADGRPPKYMGKYGLALHWTRGTL